MVACASTSDCRPSAEAGPLRGGHRSEMGAVWVPTFPLGCSEAGVPWEVVLPGRETDGHRPGYTARSEEASVARRVGQTSVSFPRGNKNRCVRGGAPGERDVKSAR